MNRKERILAGVDVGSQMGLEIGPLHDPLVKKVDGKIFYVDHCSAIDLRAKYQGQIDAAGIVEIDYVWSGGSLMDVVGDRAPFDYVVASHVIEHVPDIIGWLRDVAAILKPGGRLCLAIPDRGYTFDYLRPTSTVGEMLDAYFRKAKVPTTKHLYDNFTMVCTVDQAKAWRGEIDPERLQRIHPPGLAMQFVRRALESNEYLDCHCWVFTPQSFIGALTTLMQEELLPFEIAAFCETQYGELEFFATLRSVRR
jgi:SAM-dependent methyltransferase